MMMTSEVVVIPRAAVIGTGDPRVDRMTIPATTVVLVIC